MQILGLLGMYFDALVVEVETFFEIVLVGLYCGPLLTLIPPLTRT